MGILNALTDIVQALLIGFIMIMGVLMTRRLNRLEYKVERAQIGPSEDPQPICGCKHHQCFHDDDGCGFVTRKFSGWSMGAEHQSNEEVSPCGCKRYTGPEPLPTVLP